MNRLTKCINFQMKAMAKSSAIFLVIYCAASLALSSLFLLTVESSSNRSIGPGIYIAASIFIFIYVIAAYKEMFNYLLMFGNTRRNILLSTIVTSAGMSLSFSVISSVILRAEGVISKLDSNSSGGENLIGMIYKDSGIFSEFLWFATFLFLICSFSLLYSSLAYKFGNIFITLYWVCFGLGFIGLPILLDMNRLTVFFKAFNSFLCIDSNHGILLAPVNFIIASAIFSAVAYLVSRRQSQSA